MSMAAEQESDRKKRGQRFDSPQQETYLNLWRTYDRLRLIEDELFGRHELTAQQYNALRLLKAAHPRRGPTLGFGGRPGSRAADITGVGGKLVGGGRGGGGGGGGDTG